MKDGAGAVDDCENFVVGGGFALRSLAVVCLEEYARKFANACVVGVEFPEAGKVIHDAVGEVSFEGAYARSVMRAQNGDC